MRKFFGEFKKFITRGNVIDMAVGVIVGSAFTAIVNGMSNFILKPLVNVFLAKLLGKDSLSELYTMLLPAYTTNEEGKEILDIANSIYIDWGSFINTVINFFLTAIVLFTIVKIINKVRERNQAIMKELNEGVPTIDERKEMKKRGIKFSDKAAVAAFYAEKAKEAEEAKAAAEEAARLERLANPTTEDLLKKIIEILDKGE